jgi:hypothetical protein
MSTNNNTASKTTKITYWASTGIVSLMMTMSAYMYFTAPDIAAKFNQMGFHDWFRLELGTAKILGAIILLAPVAARLKEWAYAGFTITFISAAIAHYSVGEGPQAIAPLVFLAILMVSYTFYHRLQAQRGPVLHSAQFSA